MKNQVNLIGRVGGDVEVKSVPGTGNKIAQFKLVTSKTWKNSEGEKQEKTQWHSLVVRNQKADIAEAYVKKGSIIAITGEIDYISYQNDKKDWVNYTNINVEDITLITSPK